MGRIDIIITKARYALRDKNTRYTRLKLVSAVSEGQRDIVKKLKLLRFKETISVVASVAKYISTERVLDIIRVSDYTGAKIPVYSHYRMDQIDDNWEAHTGVGIKAIILDKQNKGTILVYPIQTADFGNIYIYGTKHTTQLTSTGPTAVPEVDRRCDLALSYFAIAFCLHDDNSKENRALGAIYYGFYTAQVASLQKLISSNSSSKIRLAKFNTGL